MVDELGQQLHQVGLHSDVKTNLEILKKSVDSMEQKNKHLETQNSELLQKIKLLEGTSTDLANENSTVTLSPSQSHKVEKEMRLFDQLSGIDLGKMNATEFLNLQQKGLDDFFEITCERIERKCPLLTSILKALLKAANWQENSAKNINFKFKQALPVLSFISHIRSQKSLTDFPKLFGLMLIAHGGSKSLLTLLSSIGLCKSYEW